MLDFIDQIFRHLKFKFRYKQVGPLHTPEIPRRTTMPGRDRKVRAAGHQ